MYPTTKNYTPCIHELRAIEDDEARNSEFAQTVSVILFLILSMFVLVIFGDTTLSVIGGFCRFLNELPLFVLIELFLGDSDVHYYD